MPLQSTLLSRDLSRLDKQYQNPVDIYNSALDRLGIGDARTKVQGLKTQLFNTEGLLRKVDDDVTARTSNSLVTDAQRNRLVTMEKEPLSMQVGDLSRGVAAGQDEIRGIETAGQRETDLKLEGYRTRRESLFSRLQDALERERIAEERRRYKIEQAEDRRRWEAQMALERSRGSGGGGGGFSLGSGFTAPSGGTKAAPRMSRKQDGGFAFTDTKGRAISAAKYSQLTGTPIGQLLKGMAKQGDTYAANAYRWIQSVQGSDMFKKKGLEMAKRNFSALFWGT